MKVRVRFVEDKYVDTVDVKDVISPKIVGKKFNKDKQYDVIYKVDSDDEGTSYKAQILNLIDSGKFYLLYLFIK